MAADRFKSPVVTAVARRQLAFGEGEGSTGGASPIKVEQALLLNSPQKTGQTFIQVQGERGGQKVLYNVML